MIENHHARPALGATPLPGGGWNFTVWAPRHERVELHLLNTGAAFPMERDALGYHGVIAEDVQAGAKYLYRFGDSPERPDPASRRQPDGVHGPSELVDLRSFEWTDRNWKGLALEDSVFYEVHVGTFTREGTFAALLASLDQLAALGVTSIEIMPIAQFPVPWNWCSHGVYPLAFKHVYCTPIDLQILVNAAHSRGLAVAVDVVDNHLGPERSYLSEYGPYFTDRSKITRAAPLYFD